MIKRRKAKFRVSMELLVQALALPDDAAIYNIRYEGFGSTFTFYVEHPDLPEICVTEGVPVINPILRVDYDKRPSTWITFDWNLEDASS